MRKTKKDGLCLLTNTRGKLVKSHLIPRAFTKPTEAGAPLMQAGSGTRVTMRFDSWYDAGIVTRAGEDILARIDARAIRELRRLKLVWSGWEGARELPAPLHRIGDTHMGVRRLVDHDARAIRLFGLSLLWRAAVSTRFEFHQVSLPPADIERLRDLILAGDPGPIDFYPIELVQMSTLGFIHNQSPLTDVKFIPVIEDGEVKYDIETAKRVDIFRFYFDGLIMHFRRHASDDGTTAELGSLVVGGAPDLVVTTVTYEQSFQSENIADVIAHAMFPDPVIDEHDSKPRRGEP